ncbi:hypothetical protein [Flavobacterium cerinum]|uniref:Uncharacterized protein n=1 Tax=Flavobacterium cerinum TaxID=2502784 RepID=A0A3S3U131_9FLAO|nr:hypothetical protein [Flavobacterium cerinum]RWX00945.1 hypothetical protein EPI11_07945 [Flavobacterium cerinum]
MITLPLEMPLIYLIGLILLSYMFAMWMAYTFGRFIERNYPAIQKHTPKEDSRLASLLECKLKCDPNQCDTWCKTKERFSRDH